MQTNVMYNEDCMEKIKQLSNNSIDSFVTDPPYNLSFMGKKWDNVGTPKEFQKWNEKWAKLAYKALKPGGYMVVFGGTRTYHRMVAGVEDVGFEIKDMIEWIYGTGFPKSYNISKGFDKQAEAEREVVGKNPNYRPKSGKKGYRGESTFRQTDGMEDKTAPATDKAKKWEGYGTALKPAHEPILLAQKPREETYCDNINKWECGGINVDECRVAGDEDTSRPNGKHVNTFTNWNCKKEITGGHDGNGRFPANLLLTHHPDCEYIGEKKVKGTPSNARQKESPKWTGVYNNNGGVATGKAGHADKNGMETVSDWDCHPSCPVRRMNEQSGELPPATSRTPSKKQGVTNFSAGNNLKLYKDKGGAARYFNQFHFVDEDFFKYTAKASKSERTCDGNVDNDHPTVKPIELMRWLVRLVTPPEGIVVDPFCGSGTTLIACMKEEIKYIGIEKDEHNYKIAKERVDYHENKYKQLQIF